MQHLWPECYDAVCCTVKATWPQDGNEQEPQFISFKIWDVFNALSPTYTSANSVEEKSSNGWPAFVKGYLVCQWSTAEAFEMFVCSCVENTRARSDEYAEKNGLPKYEYVLHPRTTGFTFIVEQLRKGQDEPWSFKYSELMSNSALRLTRFQYLNTVGSFSLLFRY